MRNCLSICHKLVVLENTSVIFKYTVERTRETNILPKSFLNTYLQPNYLKPYRKIIFIVPNRIYKDVFVSIQYSSGRRENILNGVKYTFAQ